MSRIMGHYALMGGGRLLLLSLLIAGCSSSSEQSRNVETVEAPTPIEMRSIHDSASYAVGMNFGSGVADALFGGTDSYNEELIVAGLRDGLRGGATRMEDATAQQVMMAFQQVMMEKRQQQMMNQSNTNLERERKYFEKNGAKPGVITTSSGLQYQVLTEGSGERPDANDEVSVEYRRWLVDGTEFDRSDEGIPVTFPVNGVISGWTEALQLMTKGATYRLFIPSALAYGSHGSGRLIGPNETLIFDVTLLDVHKH